MKYIIAALLLGSSLPLYTIQLYQHNNSTYRHFKGFGNYTDFTKSVDLYSDSKLNRIVAYSLLRSVYYKNNHSLDDITKIQKIEMIANHDALLKSKKPFSKEDAQTLLFCVVGKSKFNYLYIVSSLLIITRAVLGWKSYQNIAGDHKKRTKTLACLAAITFSAGIAIGLYAIKYS